MGLFDGIKWWEYGLLPVAATHAAVNAGKPIVKSALKGAGLGGGNEGGPFDPFTQGDPSAYKWGGSDGAADAAVLAAKNTGSRAQQHGQFVYEDAASNAINAQHRKALQGDWADQNAALGAASGYGSALGGLEATEGPSAAQAQLQAGTNQAVNNQLAFARSGRGIGGNAAAMGLAQSNLANIEASNANQSAALRAQENVAWRGRQAANLANAGQLQLGVGQQYGAQSQADLAAGLTNRAQNDQAALQWAGLGENAYNAGVSNQFNGQQIGNNIRQQQMGGAIAGEDAKLRAWAAQNGYNLQAQQLQNQQDAALLNTAGTITAGAIMASDVRMKTRIAPADGAGTQFARLGKDGLTDERRGYYAEQEQQAKGTGRPQMSVDLARWASTPGFGQDGAPTAMQAAASQQVAPEEEAALMSLDKGHVRTGGTSVPASASFDRGALDAASLDAVRKSPASFYDYKDPDAPGADAQRHYGPMAQDLAKTPAGASAVVQQPDGSLGVDTGRLALVHNGAISEQQKQIDTLTAQLDELKALTANPDYAPTFRTNYGVR